VEIPVEGIAFERDFRALWRADRDNADVRRFVASTRAPMR
jgi:hypothetical protein